jgi:hypothetical protein
MLPNFILVGSVIIFLVVLLIIVVSYIPNRQFDWPLLFGIEFNMVRVQDFRILNHRYLNQFARKPPDFCLLLLAPKPLFL